MYKTINFHAFVDAFRDKGRQFNFSHTGLEYLFDYLEENYENYELDVIELCCSYTEYSTIEDLLGAYDLDFEKDEEPSYKEVEKALGERTLVLACEEECILLLKY